jgi:hypothetical protein
MCIAANCSWSFVYCVTIFVLSLFPRVFYYVCIAVLHTLVAALVARNHPGSAGTGHLGTGFFWFPCV